MQRWRHKRVGGCRSSYLDTPPQQWGFHLEDGMEERHAQSAAAAAAAEANTNGTIHDQPNISYKSRCTPTQIGAHRAL